MSAFEKKRLAELVRQTGKINEGLQASIREVRRCVLEAVHYPNGTDVMLKALDKGKLEELLDLVMVALNTKSERNI